VQALEALTGDGKALKRDGIKVDRSHRLMHRGRVIFVDLGSGIGVPAIAATTLGLVPFQLEYMPDDKGIMKVRAGVKYRTPTLRFDAPC
jgi:hypothetical protein